MPSKDSVHDPTSEDDKTCTTVATVPHSTQSPTLLPSPIASAVSLVTRSSSLYLQLGSFIGGLALDGARVTTLTSLELSRAVLEGILSRAGRDVALRSTGEIGRAEAENILEKSIATLHSTITAISFAASTGFYFSATALGSAADISQQLLASLDSILGSTDSSRAISSIVTLIRREFTNPATGLEGEQVGVADLLIGICGLALLQKWCAKIVEVEIQERKSEEILWDVVVLDDGRRADIVDTALSVYPSPPVDISSPMGTDSINTVEKESQSREESDDDLPEINLKQKIMQSLPEKASVSIRTEIATTKTVTVDIVGAHPPTLTLPSGVEIVEEDSHPMDNLSKSTQEFDTPRYHVVYRIKRSRVHETNIQSRDFLMDQDNRDEKSIEYPNPLGISSPQKSPKEISSVNQTTDLPQAQQTPQLNEPTIFMDSPIVPETQPFHLELPKSRENVANQKRTRQPTSTGSSTTDLDKPASKKLAGSKLPTSKKSKSIPKSSEKKGTFREAFKKGSGTTLSSLWNKDTSSEPPTAKQTPQRPPWGASPSAKSRNPTVPAQVNKIASRDTPRVTQLGSPNHFLSRDLGTLYSSALPRSPSRTSYYSVHEQRHGSNLTHTDTYSIHSIESRPGSPTTFRTHLRAESNLIRARSERNISSPPASPHHHRRSKSHVPSIYTIDTHSTTSLAPWLRNRASAFENSEAIATLTETGAIAGLFPQHHLVRNVTRFIKFASASYGSSFLRVMGIVASATSSKREIDTKHHHEHHSFSNHTQLPPDTILLSSFVDPAGGTDSTGQTGTGVPMVHFVSLDHDSKAVVLTCRGTLGFEDVLTDMTCDYDTISYRGKEYSVHKGIHASAKRLLEGGGGRVMITIAAALEEFPDYGLVLCGHSLGGSVTALLAVMISEPSSNPESTAFVTASNTPPPQLFLTQGTSDTNNPQQRHLPLPPGRPIHVYAYGPAATFSPSLRLATRGLITTIVNSQDVVPFLSLGVLHDMQAVALAFKNDDSGAKGEVRARVWEGLKGGFSDRWYNRSGESTGTREDDQWAYSALKTLRVSMLSPKLVPPGEVFVIETARVLRRDAWVSSEGGRDPGLGRPATRSILKWVRDVEKRYGELRFGGSMLLDHSPGRYEGSLASLKNGVLS